MLSDILFVFLFQYLLMHKNADWNCSPDRFKLLKAGGETDLSAEGGENIDSKEAAAVPSTASAGQDGLSDIKYKVIEKQLKPLYTHIVVDLWFFIYFLLPLHLEIIYYNNQLKTWDNFWNCC